ncbi:hypothetical protein BX666DRAFT_1265388 [Dichotomocladium elegans]|nr:hypothetical protein BX666DRAFT_1265388 [Dichotomocladium elegans]
MSHFDRSSAHLSNEHGRQTFASELLHAPSGETDGNNSTCSSKEQLYTQPKGDDYPLPARKSNHPYGKSQKLGLSSNYCTQVKRDIEKAGHGTIRQQSQCQRRVYKWMNYVCFPCCCCSTPMWLRSVGCILLLAVAVFGVVVGILAASYRAPSLDMNGVTVDPTGLPLFSRVNDTSFDLNLGLQFVGRNPNMEPVMFASIGVKAYYPTAPKWLLASSSMENVVIKGSGMTNFTYPIHIHYDMAGDTDKAVLKDIASKCEHGKLSFHTDISMVIEILDVYIPIPTFRKTVMFDCPNELVNGPRRCI